MALDIRTPAEWESCQFIMVAIPGSGSDWDYILDDIRSLYRDMTATFVANGERVVALSNDPEETSRLLAGIDPASLFIVECDYNDTWVRDYGPITVIREERLRALDFGFNGWGLKFAADRDNLVNRQLADKGIMPVGVYRNERDFILEGGSIESDGNGTVLTTSRCLCSPNRNGGKTKGELNEILAERLGAEHVLWLDYGALAGDDTDSHIDTLARLAPDNTIVFTGCRDESDGHFEELLRMRAQLTMFRNATGEPFNLVELPLPDPVYGPDGERLPATYANYLVTPRNIFMPVYGQPLKDELAAGTLRMVFGDRKVVPVESTLLTYQHGSLHCATMQIPEGIFKEPRL